MDGAVWFASGDILRSQHPERPLGRACEPDELSVRFHACCEDLIKAAALSRFRFPACPGIMLCDLESDVRFQLGEGIEKEVSDFAAEVAAAVNA